MSLFEKKITPLATTIIDGPGYIYYYPQFFSKKESHTFKSILEKTLEFRQDYINFMGKSYPIPRLQAWYGERAYTYSGIKMNPLPFTPQLLEIRERISEVCDTQFNSVLINNYRDGNDSVSYHSDDEKELGVNPVIASVSFGATRKFLIKSKTDKSLKTLYLMDGSLLLMGGNLQTTHQHAIPKEKGVKGNRLNLTFRSIIN